VSGVPAIVTNIGYQGIIVAPGKHHVDMVYRNDMVVIGLWTRPAALLLVIEFIAAMLWFIGLFIISAAFNAPLQDHSTPDCTPNPSKAPWYLLNLQELLLHMDKGLAGVVVPTIWIVFMMAIPYIDRSRAGVGIWFTSPRGLRVTYFAAIYATVLTFSLILFDKLLKDHGYIQFASDNLPGGKQLFPDYIIPITTMTVLSILLVVLVKVIFKGDTRDWMIAVWTGFVCVFLVLTIVGTSMRGPGMDMYAPWALPSTHQCFAP